MTVEAATAKKKDEDDNNQNEGQELISYLSFAGINTWLCQHPNHPASAFTSAQSPGNLASPSSAKCNAGEFLSIRRGPPMRPFIAN
jgi:hypothetical protein